MAIKRAISSEDAVMSYAEEISPGVLAVTPLFYALDPNEMNDFGPELKKVSRMPIGSGRQRKKGETVGLDAAGEYVGDFTQNNVQRLLQSFFFADFRRKDDLVATGADAFGYIVPAGGAAYVQNTLVAAKGAPVAANNGLKVVGAGSDNDTVAVTGLTAGTGQTVALSRVGFQFVSGDVIIEASVGAYPILRATAKNLTQLGLIPGEFVFIGGDGAATKYATAANNGWARVKSVTATDIVFDKTDFEMVDDAGTGKTIQLFFGRVLKNELGALIKAHTYTFERDLGAPDTSFPSLRQGEYISGMTGNELTLSMPEEDKLEISLGFMGLDYYTRTSTEGLLVANRTTVPDESAYNSSNDIVRMRMSVIDPTTSAPDALFAIFQELELTINNNLEPYKGLGYFGSVFLNPGTFEVGGSTTAYFVTTEAVDAVRNNADVTFDVMLFKENRGVCIDFPLVSLGDGRLAIEKDSPVMIPLDLEAADAGKYDINMRHSAMMVFFDYLPNAADVRIP